MYSVYVGRADQGIGDALESLKVLSQWSNRGIAERGRGAVEKECGCSSTAE